MEADVKYTAVQEQSEKVQTTQQTLHCHLSLQTEQYTASKEDSYVCLTAVFFPSPDKCTD